MVLRELKLTLQGRSPNPHGATTRHPGEASDKSKMVLLSGGLYLSEVSSYSGALGISVAAGWCKNGYRGGGAKSVLLGDLAGYLGSGKQASPLQRR